jgi:hypothetical protein
MKFLQHWFKHEVKLYCLRSMNLLILFHVRRIAWSVEGVYCCTSLQEWPQNYSNCPGISLLSPSNKVLSNILLCMLCPYVDETTGVHQCGFWLDRLTTDQIFCIHQILEKKIGVQWDSTSAIHKAYDSVRREVLYSILIDFEIPVELFMLIKMYWHETYSKVHVDNIPWKCSVVNLGMTETNLNL